MTLTFSETNCNARCHQACNGLTTKQTRHAKSCGCTIKWKCPQHAIAIAEIIIPFPPLFELPSRPSAAGRLCSICNNPNRSHYANLEYHCEVPSCANVCHLSATCSGFVNPWGTTRAHIIYTRIWHCHLHFSPTASGHSSTKLDTSPAHPTPPTLIKLLLESRYVPSWRVCWSLLWSAKYFAALHSITVPVRCNACNKGFHQKCSTGAKVSSHDD